MTPHVGLSGQVARRRPLNLVVLGSTGSIGTQALDIARALPDDVRIVGLAARSRTQILARQVAEFRPRYAATPDASALRAECGDVAPTILSLTDIVAQPDVDLVLVATVGAAGLEPTLAALSAGKNVALANKEVLVMAGALVVAETARTGARLLPVDSEHSAIWQCLRGESSADLSAGAEVRRLILTASGGAFRDRPLADLAVVTPAEALRHPNWTMGAKVTVDSATLLNKGLEVIEAHWLFGVPFDRIDIVLHRESIVHSLVEFIDGSMKAQLGAPDMRAPIQYALTYPRRVAGPSTHLDLFAVGRLSFELLDASRYPCYTLAREAGVLGGTAPAVLAGAADVAVETFLAGRIGFLEIPRLIEGALGAHRVIAVPSLPQVLQADAWAREFVLGHVPAPTTANPA